MPRQAVSGTENWRAAGNHANALEKLGFCAYLNRLLTQAKPLTVGPSELTCLEFGSPVATLLRKKNGEFGREFNEGGAFRSGCCGSPRVFPAYFPAAQGARRPPPHPARRLRPGRAESFTIRPPRPRSSRNWQSRLTKNRNSRARRLAGRAGRSILDPVGVAPGQAVRN